MKVCLLPQSTTSLKHHLPRATATGGEPLQVSAAVAADDVLAFGKPEPAGGAVCRPDGEHRVAKHFFPGAQKTAERGAR